jgi:FixJ family two-component response regulator
MSDACFEGDACSTVPARIAVVDDDESVRESLPDLLRSFGFEVAPFASAEEFLASESVGATDCVILDVAMPGMNGPALQRVLAGREPRIPIVFITAHANESLRDRVLAEGAVACLSKPFSETSLMTAVRAALGAKP